MRRNFAGKTAVVTGAGSGIGRATAIEFAKRGCHVAISDVNEDALEEVGEVIEGHGRRAHRARLDVSDREAIEDYAARLATEFDELNVVVNNAGVACIGSVENTSLEDLEWVMQINFWGAVYGISAFLPLLKRAEWGQVVNISSLFGIISVPHQSAYNASKFALRGYTESLAMELEIERSSVGATSVHPGGVRTSIVSSARFVGPDDPDRSARLFANVATTSPAKAAKCIVKAVERKKSKLLIGHDARAIELAQRVAPVGHRSVLKAVTKATSKVRGDAGSAG